MSKKSTFKTSTDQPIRTSDIKSGKLVLRQRGADGAVLVVKRRVNIYLDSVIVEHFKEKAGERGYQTLINESLRNAIRAESLEQTVRLAVRQELKGYKIS